MSQSSAEETAPQTLGELDVEEFFGLLVQVLERRRAKGDPKLMDISMKEFSEFMLSQMKTKSYAQAQVEAETTARILEDWKALLSVDAVSNPFRIKTRSDVEKLKQNLDEVLGTNGTQFIAIVGIATINPQGGFERPKLDI